MIKRRNRPENNFVAKIVFSFIAVADLATTFYQTTQAKTI